MNTMLMVLMNAVPGREADFERWIDEHLKTMVQLDGFVCAHRFEHAGAQPQEYRHLAIYEVDDGQMETALTSLAEAKAQGLISWSESLDPRTAPLWFAPVSTCKPL